MGPANRAGVLTPLIIITAVAMVGTAAATVTHVPGERPTIAAGSAAACVPPSAGS